MKKITKSFLLVLFLFFWFQSIIGQESQEILTMSPLYGKTLHIIGDSYVKNHRRPVEESWHAKIAKKYSMTYNNYGWNGNCIAFDRTSEGFGPPIYLRYTEMADSADYVIVMAGHNDADNIGTLGSLEDFKEKLALLCEGLIAKYPSAKIAFFTSWRVPRPNFVEVASATEEICNSYSIPVYNAQKNSGVYVWNLNFRKLYFQRPDDTAHLNNSGHDLFMNRAEAFLLGL